VVNGQNPQELIRSNMHVGEKGSSRKREKGESRNLNGKGEARGLGPILPQAKKKTKKSSRVGK